MITSMHEITMSVDWLELLITFAVIRTHRLFLSSQTRALRIQIHMQAREGNWRSSDVDQEDLFALSNGYCFWRSNSPEVLESVTL